MTTSPPQQKGGDKMSAIESPAIQKGGESMENMEELCNLIRTSLDDGKMEGYCMILQTLLQHPLLLTFYSFLIARWLIKTFSL